jgi:hypothetical protein
MIMFELKNGMILELCNGDFGAFYDGNVICQSYGFNIYNVGLDSLFGKSIINKEAVRTVYKNKCIFIDGMFDRSRYHESSVLWSRNDCIYEGDAFTCMNANAADKYHVEVDKTYIKTKNGIEEVSEGIIPYLKVEVKNFND